MLRNNVGSFHPRNMSGPQSDALQTFLRENPRILYLEKYKTYSFETTDKNSNRKIIHEFELTANVIARQRKDNKTGIRYEVFDDKDKIGSGTYGLIVRCAGNLALDNPSRFFKSNARAIKIQIDEKAAKEEAEYSRLAPQLHMKPLVVANAAIKTTIPSKHFFMVERLLPGVNFYEIIKPEFKTNRPKIDTDQRLILSINLLVAIQEQAHKLGMIHRDIKPENIIVDSKTNTVNLVDYRFATQISSPAQSDIAIGTPITAPPEQLDNCPDQFRKTTVKSDSYSAGKTLAELWNAPAMANLLPPGKNRLEDLRLLTSYAHRDTEFSYKTFFRGNLSDDHVKLMKNVFEQLSRANPDERWTLDQAIATLRQIQQERLAHSIATKPAGKRI